MVEKNKCTTCVINKESNNISSIYISFTCYLNNKHNIFLKSYNKKIKRFSKT